MPKFNSVSLTLGILCFGDDFLEAPFCCTFLKYMYIKKWNISPGSRVIGLSLQSYGKVSNIITILVDLDQ
jgi:hypothetical protein